MATAKKQTATKKVASKKIDVVGIDLLARKDGLKVYKGLYLTANAASIAAEQLLTDDHPLKVDAVVLRKTII